MYSAGRTLAELAFWSWLKENNPPFVANCIVPDGQFGRVLDVEHLNVGDASSTGQLKRALPGDWQKVGFPLGKRPLATVLWCFVHSVWQEAEQTVTNCKSQKQPSTWMFKTRLDF